MTAGNNGMPQGAAASAAILGKNRASLPIWAALISVLIIAASFAAPGLVRVGFTPIVVFFALYSYFYWRPAYLTLFLWLLFLTPLIRRLVDFQLGWQAGNVIMLATYLTALPMALAWLDLLIRGRGLTAVATWIAGMACVYGLILAGFHGNLASGAVDVTRWLAPILMIAFIVRHADEWPDFRTVI